MREWLKSVVPPVDFGWNRVRARCGLRTCHNKLLMRSVPQSRAGIQVGNEWYCSADCFAGAMQTPLAALIGPRLTEMPRNPRLSVGLAMLSKGILTEAQLREATARSQWRGEDLETTLLQLGLANEKQLAAARSAQWGYPVLTQEGPGPTVRANLPLEFLRGLEAVPVYYAAAAKRLVLGFVRRVEPSVLQAIEQITGCRAEPCFLTPAEFQQQVERCVACDGYEEALLDQAATPAHMARTLGGFAVEVSARQVDYVACKSWIWVRLAGRKKTVDVLFALKSVTGRQPESFVSQSFAPQQGLGALG
ncbi:MAG TPA: hypothetical protein VHX37_01945 [Acidobacteriaceae bacterium]|jgi:hypothetical protein|nr:hypothetical protein [Acidobacteriaceae bacterium]